MTASEDKTKPRFPEPTATYGGPARQGPRTFIVMGVARGGTSMVAGALRQLGVPIGDRLDEAAQEDLDFIELQQRHLFRNRYLLPYLGLHGPFRQLVRQRNRSHDLWGWKDPMSFLYVRGLRGVLRLPHVIAVFRDPLAAAERENIAMGTPHMVSLPQVIRRYRRMVAAIRAMKCPALLISYERSLEQPEAFVRALAEFTGLSCEEDRVAEIATFVRPGRGTATLIDEIRLLDLAHSYQKRIDAKK